VNIFSGGSPYFEELAADTGGKSYVCSDPSEAVDRLRQAVTEVRERRSST